MKAPDVSGLVPEARETALAAARVYLEHTRPWFVGLIAHGSVVKGGFIPGCSDIDFHLYLDVSAFTDGGGIPLGLASSIHRDLSKIDPAPFRYIQCDALSERAPRGYVGPIPGAYRVVAGRVPVPEATPQELKHAAREAIVDLDPLPSFIIGGLLEHGSGRLEANVRLLCTKVWPMLHNVLVFHGHDPVEVWNLSKDRAIDLIPEQESLGQTIREFHGVVTAYYPDETSVDRALEVVEAGVDFLRAVRISARDL